MLRDVKTPHRMTRLIAVSIDGSAVAGGTATTNGIVEGLGQVTVTENSSGNYTINFLNPFVRPPVVASMPFTDVSTLRLIATTVSSVQIEQVGADQTTPLADGDFHLLILGFDCPDQT